MPIYKYAVGEAVYLTPEIEREHEENCTPDHEYPGEMFIIESHGPWGTIFAPPTYTVDPAGGWRKTKHFYYENELMPATFSAAKLFKNRTLPKL